LSKITEVGRIAGIFFPQFCIKFAKRWDWTKKLVDSFSKKLLVSLERWQFHCELLWFFRNFVNTTLTRIMVPKVLELLK
jgi:hypothetical protein